MSRAANVPTDRDLDKLVPRRSDVQAFLLDLHKFGSHAVTATEKIVFQNLVGVGFGLWRAVFLTRRVRRAKKTHEAAKEFLKILINDNAIAYAQESRCLSWTSGFNLNNAYYRLDCLYDLMNLPRSDHRADVRSFVRLQRTVRSEKQLGPALGSHWDTALAAAKEILAHIQTGSRTRPHKRPRRPS